MRTAPLASASARGYDRTHRAERDTILADHPPCHWCGAQATTVDHVPPLRTFATPQAWVGMRVPSCRRCQNRHIAERDDT